METITIWDRLQTDPRVRLGSLGTSWTFFDFVSDNVAEIIDEYGNQIASFPIWIEVQYRIAETYASIVPSDQNRNIARSLSGFHNPDLFLAVHDISEEGYALQLRGLLEEEYAQLEAGQMTVGELFERNPVAFFGRLLPSNKLKVN